jgi:tetratricopeptide (TPR) repeat protein
MLPLAALLALGIGLARGSQETREKWIETVVPRMGDAEAQLGHARRLKRQMAEKQDKERAFWRDLAVEAYQAVRVFHPEARAACVEAAFRAGEVLRAGQDEPRALEEFHWAARHDEAGEFRARARLEIGHIHRRRERWREALQEFLDAAADVRADGSRREEAWLWAGTCWQALGRPEDARDAWRRVARDGRDPLARIQAFDELARQLLLASDVEGAAGILDECLRALSAVALEETETGERVRRALLRMRIVDDLPRAIEHRNASAEPGTTRKS